MSILVDLKARTVHPDSEIYVARPGKGYKLYQSFIGNGIQGIVGPDLPFLELVKGTPLSEHKDIERRIRRSRAIRSWYRSGQQNAGPSRDLNTYTDAKADKSVHSLRATIGGFFEKLKIGDLVIVPPSAYAQDAYIGEVVSAPIDYVSIKVPVYGDDPIMGRQVRWLARIQKRRLPTSILEALQHPTSIYLLSRLDRAPIYEAAFRSFIDLSGKDPHYISRFDVSSEKYTSSTDLLLQAFFNSVASNAKTLESGHKVTNSFLVAAFDDLGKYSLDLRTNVNSPGFLTLTSKFATPLIAAALFVIAVKIGPDAAEAAKNGTIIIGNSMAPAGDPCTAPVIEGTLEQLKLLGLTNEWVKACEVAKLAADKAGVTGTVTVEQKP